MGIFPNKWKTNTLQEAYCVWNKCIWVSFQTSGKPCNIAKTKRSALVLVPRSSLIILRITTSLLPQISISMLKASVIDVEVVEFV